MSKLPADLSAKDVERVLNKLGFIFVRQAGSHMVFTRGEGQTKEVVTVPNHKHLKKGTLRQIIKDSGITVERFNELR